RVSVSDTFTFLSMLQFGGEAAVLLAATEGLRTSLRFSKKAITILFTTAVMACSTVLTVLTLRTYWRLIAVEPGASLSTFIIGISIAALTQYIANSGLVALFAAYRTEQPLWLTWKRDCLWSSLTNFVGAFA